MFICSCYTRIYRTQRKDQSLYVVIWTVDEGEIQPLSVLVWSALLKLTKVSVLLLTLEMLFHAAVSF